MSEAGKTYLLNFATRWQRMLYARSLLYGLGAGLCAGLLARSLWSGAFAFLAIALVSLLASRPWTRNMDRVCAYVDSHVADAGFSSGLLLQPDAELPGLSRLQKHRVASRLQASRERPSPPVGFRGAILWGVFALGIGLLGHQMGLLRGWTGFPEPGDSATQGIRFAPADSVAAETSAPVLTRQRITVNFPAYTGQPPGVSEDPNIRAVAGSRIRWELDFEGPIHRVRLERMGEEYPLRQQGGLFRLELPLEESGFYSFRFTDSLGRGYVTDLYSLEAVPDRAPEVEIAGVPQYAYFDAPDEKSLRFTGNLTDDFGLQQARIVATVSKGSGESVKFREERLDFDQPVPPGARRLMLTKTIDLDQLGMDPGDELYFYVEASDNKEPQPNVARSETFFAVIRDTTTDRFAVEGSLGVDQMPDYFRSQRQLIIDTEKLIAEKPDIPEREFKFRSNELGFDQKALRLKYGQFMGDEAEMAMAPAPGGQAAGSGEVGDGEAMEETESEGDDPLEAYTHDHDGDNEHHLVDGDSHGDSHGEAPGGDGEEAEDPLHDYLHNHADPEASTLFEESLKVKLRKALNIMWDAELQLRLYKPEASLPYQYEALKLIQEIKNSARVYVHRIGFDPPPIKEDKRLSGDVSEISDYRKRESTTYELPLGDVRRAVGRLEELIGGSPFGEGDGLLFQSAGNQLASRALEEPGRYLDLLRGLQSLEKASGRSMANYRSLHKGLYALLPDPEKVPSGSTRFADPVNERFLKELRAYDD